MAYSTHALKDSSFYVAKSTISFLKNLLLKCDEFQNCRIEAEIIKMIGNECIKCKPKDKTYYLDLVYQMFACNERLSWKLLEAFGGIASFICNVQTKNAKLLQAISEVCHKIVQNGR